MYLYEIDRAILGLVDMETGEILDWEAFEALQMEREAKIENVACWIKNLAAEAAAIRAEEIALARRRRHIEGMMETREKWLQDALGGQKFQTAKCAVSFRNTTKVDVTDQAAVIEWAQRNHRDDLLKYAEPSINNKNDLAALLKGGVEVPGCQLVAGLSMSVK